MLDHHSRIEDLSQHFRQQALPQRLLRVNATIGRDCECTRSSAGFSPILGPSYQRTGDMVSEQSNLPFRHVLCGPAQLVRASERIDPS